MVFEYLFEVFLFGGGVGVYLVGGVEVCGLKVKVRL